MFSGRNVIYGIAHQSAGRTAHADLFGMDMDDGSSSVHQPVLVSGNRIFSETGPKSCVDLAFSPVFCSHLRLSSLSSSVPGLPEEQGVPGQRSGRQAPVFHTDSGEYCLQPGHMA